MLFHEPKFSKRKKMKIYQHLTECFQWDGYNFRRYHNRAQSHENFEKLPKKLSVDPVNTHLCTFKNDIFKIFYLDQRKKTVIYFCLTILFLSTLILECILFMINQLYISWQPDIPQQIYAPFWKAHNVSYISYLMLN